MADALGVDIVIVGSGAPRYAKAFREAIHCEFPVYTDQRLATFKALSFSRSLAGVLKASLWKRGFEAFRDGYRQGKVQGDTRQLGGMLGVTATGEVFYRYASEHAGDHPSLEVALAPLATSKG